MIMVTQDKKKQKRILVPQLDGESKYQVPFSRRLEQTSISWVEKRYFESIRRWIYDYTGLYYPERKQALLYHRLKKLCWRLGIPSLKELDRHLHKKDFPGLAREVACTISTNHTYFFREEKVMQFLQTRILLALPAEGKWRFWSAAASSGEEAYTVAIILSEALGLERAQNQVAILGTDIDRVAIEQAERGIYHEQSLNNIPKHLRQRYFRPVRSEQWRINSALKQMCFFRRLNLISAPWPFKNEFHVILCRNVLYYFDPEHQRDLAERLYDATLPGGWLITSVTEPVQALKTRWRPAVPGVYRKA